MLLIAGDDVRARVPPDRARDGAPPARLGRDGRGRALAAGVRLRDRDLPGDARRPLPRRGAASCSAGALAWLAGSPLVGLVSALAWLGMKYVPLGLVVAAFVLWRAPVRERAWIVGLGAVSGAAYVGWHLVDVRRADPVPDEPRLPGRFGGDRRRRAPRLRGPRLPAVGPVRRPAVRHRALGAGLPRWSCRRSRSRGVRCARGGSS